MPAALRPGIGQRGKPKHCGERYDNPVPRRLRRHPGCGDQQHAAADPCHGAGLPDQTDQIAQPRRLDGGARKHFCFSQHAVNQRYCDRADPSALQQNIAHRISSIHGCMVAMAETLAPVNTVVYGQVVAGIRMADQLSAKDWLDQGLRALARSGFTALKAEPLAKAMGVSRGSFYWHFVDIGAYHAAILKHWREVAAEQIIANLEAASGDDDPVQLLLRRAFGTKPALAGLCGETPQYVRIAGGCGPSPGANSLLGVSRLCAVGQAVAAGTASRGSRRAAPNGRTVSAGGYTS